MDSLLWIMYLELTLLAGSRNPHTHIHGFEMVLKLAILPDTYPEGMLLLFGEGPLV